MIKLTAEQESRSYNVNVVVDASQLEAKISENVFQKQKSDVSMIYTVNNRDIISQEGAGNPTSFCYAGLPSGNYPISLKLTLNNRSLSPIEYDLNGGQQFRYDEPDISQVANSLPKVLESDSTLSLFVEALKATGLMDQLYAYADKNYLSEELPFYKYDTGYESELAKRVEYRTNEFTVFALGNAVLRGLGINNLSQLSAYASAHYPAAVNDNNYKSAQNALYQFMAYHILDCHVRALDHLTVRYDFGVDTLLANPVDWYRTLLPNAWLKAEHLSCDSLLGESAQGSYCLNRVFDSETQKQMMGASIIPADQNTTGINGSYYYLDSPIAFDEETRNKVFNTRMRVDFSSIFSEVVTQDIRMNGDITQVERNLERPGKNGFNYCFPAGSLKDVDIKGKNGVLVYRRPREGFWCANGDEFDVIGGDFDITFNLPAVATSGKYQIRLGYAAMQGRATVEVYVDGVMVNPNFDMEKPLSGILPADTIVYSNGSVRITYQTWNTAYSSLSEEERSAIRAQFGAKGYLPGPRSVYWRNGTALKSFCDNERTPRQIAATVNLTAGQTHTFRMRKPDTGSSFNVLTLDYIELVPESVYNNAEHPEDDL